MSEVSQRLRPDQRKICSMCGSSVHSLGTRDAFEQPGFCNGAFYHRAASTAELPHT